MGRIEKLYEDYKDRAHIYVMYIREAHPVGGPRRPPEEFKISDPKTLEERQRVAREFAEKVGLTIPILVDTMDDHVEQSYAGWPDRIYVIDATGKIAFQGDSGPRGFPPAIQATPGVLDELLGRKPKDEQRDEKASGRKKRRARTAARGEEPRITRMGVDGATAMQLVGLARRRRWWTEHEVAFEPIFPSFSAVIAQIVPHTV
ncbi:MAG: hypothetical protein HY000_07820 [Planctomycetes bacterium]|nr:hypothetical protein [Planctomycetota bacterium]